MEASVLEIRLLSYKLYTKLRLLPGRVGKVVGIISIISNDNISLFPIFLFLPISWSYGYIV